jgi:hypothetical protein
MLPITADRHRCRIFGLAALAAVLAAAACTPAPVPPAPADPRLGASAREDRAGWIFIHLEGSPRQIGFQHGWHLAGEIDDLLQTMAFYLGRETRRDWTFYRESAGRMFWPKLEAEYQEEITGIVEGIRARRPDLAYDYLDITALNGWIELAWYYVPWLDEQQQPGTGDNRAPAYCSAFIATGSHTADGRIVMAHNNWSEYILGQRWNVILDIVPAKGHRMLLDAMPGYLHSGDDFVINAAGLVYTETTICQFKGFREAGTPEFVRARRAAQYGRTIDDFVRIMTADSNGAYANDWLVGDLNANEIARLELGLTHHRLWRTADGCYVGANYPLDETIIAAETTFDPSDTAQSVCVRRARWEALMAEHKGALDVHKAMAFLGDHVDAASGTTAANGNVLCGHVDGDPKGLPEFKWAPHYPGGAVQGKATSAALARDLKFWARMGHPCGAQFRADAFAREHPEFAWQLPFLRNMPAQPWTLFGVR